MPVRLAVDTDISLCNSDTAVAEPGTLHTTSEPIKLVQDMYMYMCGCLLEDVVYTVQGVPQSKENSFKNIYPPC